MYNMKFYSQMERFRRDLWGTGCVDIRGASDEAHLRYSLPPDVKLLECREGTNGEWGPVSDLEKTVDENSE